MTISAIDLYIFLGHRFVGSKVAGTLNFTPQAKCCFDAEKVFQTFNLSLILEC